MANLESLPNPESRVRRRRTRREFLSLSGSAALGLALAACAPATPAQPTPAANPAGQSSAASPTPAAQPAAKPAAPTVISKERKQIVVSTWGGVTEEGLRKVVSPAFEKKYNATVAYDIGGAAARYNKVRAQAANPQVTVFFNTHDLLYEALQQGLLAKLNTANIPNLKNVYDWALPKAIEGYGVGYTALGYGLLVAKDKVKTPIKSWKDLWGDEFKGKLAIAAPSHSAMSQLLVVAAELFGGSEQNIEPGLKALAELRPIKQSVFWTDYSAMVKSGEVTLASEFDYYGMFMQREGYAVSWVLPEEKAIGSLSSASILKGAPNPELGEAFIDMLLDPELQAGVAKETFQPPTNKLVKLESPLADQVMYGTRLDRVRWFDSKLIAANREKWLERIDAEVVPKWRV